MTQYPLSTCLHPMVIYNKTLRQDILVPCGHCQACLLKRASSLTRLCELESLTHYKTFFITLTYNNFYLPKASLIPTEDIDYYNLVDIESGELLEENIFVDDETLEVIHRKCGSDYIPYLCKYELQLFFKRLRKYYKNEKLRYFACGEYGPLHLRPHYHILLWFEENEKEKYFPTLPNRVCQAWPFGRTDVQIAKGKCSRYVAGYANSFGFVPSILKVSSVRPFTVHSQKLGFSFVEESCQEVYKSTYDDFIKRGYVCDGNYKEFDLWRSAFTMYFPRCIEYASKTPYERLESYGLYNEVPNYCKTIADATRLIVNCLIEPYEVTSDTEYLYRYFNRIFGDAAQFAYDNDIIKETISRRVYTELSISKHFLSLSESIDLNYVYNIPPCLHVKEHILYELIESFYITHEYRMLTSSLSRLEKYMDENPEDNDMLINYYSIEYEQQNSANLLANKVYRQAVEKRFNEAIKHKKQNDINKILFKQY